jgi:hypothetical protein
VAACADRLAYEIYSTKVQGGVRTRVATSIVIGQSSPSEKDFELRLRGSTPTNLRMGPRYAAFATYGSALDGGEWVVDLSDRKIWRLAMIPGLQNVLLNGDNLLYATPESGQFQRMRVVVLRS